ncbi:MAG: deoxynucleotide monophosphate kinase [Pseudomonadota bacterium]
MNVNLVGLVGASGAGKTTIADNLVASHGYTKFHVGTPLKGMLQAFGVPEADLHASPQSRKKPHELLCRKSVRFALSTLGTEWGRDTIGESIWSKNLKKRLEQHFEVGGGEVIVDDLRFPSDWSAIKSLGGILVFIRRAEVD